MSVVVRVIILITLLLSCGYALEGGYLLLVWAGVLPGQDGDLADRIVIAYNPAFTYLALFGVLFFAFGTLALLAALALLWSRPWGRFLTVIVAESAILLGLCSLDMEVSNVPLGVAMILYGVPALVILSRTRREPAGIDVLRLVSILLGFLVALSCSQQVFDVVDGVLHPEAGVRGNRAALLAALGGARRDPADFLFAFWALIGFVTGLLLVASGTSLLASGWTRRFRIAAALLIAAVIAEMVLAVFALLGALLGHTEGLLESFLLVVYFPAAIVLLILTASGVWYLTRPHIRHALTVE